MGGPEEAVDVKRDPSWTVGVQWSGLNSLFPCRALGGAAVCYADYDYGEGRVYAGASWMLDTKSLVIGRSYRCDIVVDDGTVSRQHCRIQKVLEGVRLEDLGQSRTRPS